jgi:hypothetical protein
VAGGVYLTNVEIQASLVELWTHVLSVEHLRPSDNIFEHGAHSLHVMAAVNFLRSRVHDNLSPLFFFENPVIAQQADRLVGDMSEYLL